MNTASKIDYLQNQTAKMNEAAGSGFQQTTKEYAEYCLENDPTFFNWVLPSDEYTGDYGLGATDEQKEYVKKFISELSNY